MSWLARLFSKTPRKRSPTDVGEDDLQPTSKRARALFQSSSLPSNPFKEESTEAFESAGLGALLCRLDHFLSTLAVCEHRRDAEEHCGDPYGCLSSYEHYSTPCMRRPSDLSGLKPVFRLCCSSLVPRPLVLVASLDKQGNLNIVPSSFCTLVSEEPAYISIGLEKDLPEDAPADPASNIVQTK